MATVREEFNGKCCMCGEDAVVFWMCENTIYVCRNCALDKLPLMIGEAAVFGLINRQDMMTLPNRVLLAFWRGAAIELATKRNER